MKWGQSRTEVQIYVHSTPKNTLMADITERDGDRGEQIINYTSMH
jgi:hypothetical protein